jgi:hypothetical protein
VAVFLPFIQVFNDFPLHDTILTVGGQNVKEKGARVTPFSREKPRITTAMF